MNTDSDSPDTDSGRDPGHPPDSRDCRLRKVLSRRNRVSAAGLSGRRLTKENSRKLTGRSDAAVISGVSGVSGSGVQADSLPGKINSRRFEDGRLLFIFNRKSGLAGRMSDSFRNLFSDKEAECPLYNLIHGPFSVRSEWKEFLDDLPYPSEMLFCDDFTEKYGTGVSGLSGYSSFPAVLFVYRDRSGMAGKELIRRERIGRCDKLACFRKVVLRYLEKNLPDTDLLQKTGGNGKKTEDPAETENDASGTDSGRTMSAGRNRAGNAEKTVRTVKTVKNEKLHSSGNTDDVTDDDTAVISRISEKGEEDEDVDWARRKEAREKVHDLDHTEDSLSRTIRLSGKYRGDRQRQSFRRCFIDEPALICQFCEQQKSKTSDHHDERRRPAGRLAGIDR